MQEQNAREVHIRFRRKEEEEGGYELETLLMGLYRRGEDNFILPDGSILQGTIVPVHYVPCNALLKEFNKEKEEYLANYNTLYLLYEDSEEPAEFVRRFCDYLYAKEEILADSIGAVSGIREYEPSKWGIEIKAREISDAPSPIGIDRLMTALRRMSREIAGKSRWTDRREIYQTITQRSDEDERLEEVGRYSQASRYLGDYQSQLVILPPTARLPIMKAMELLMASEILEREYDLDIIALSRTDSGRTMNYFSLWQQDIAKDKIPDFAQEIADYLVYLYGDKLRKFIQPEVEASNIQIINKYDSTHRDALELKLHGIAVLVALHDLLFNPELRGSVLKLYIHFRTEYLVPAGLVFISSARYKRIIEELQRLSKK
ncbi:hypothetical protein JW930_02810 [Candidatus Woesearchaeota archaeon]|nr:hypothetical protein [Candidatus Woesearchaeota archaeon]